MEVDASHAIIEVEVPSGWIGKTVGELDIRKNIISILWLLKATEKLICLSQQTLCLPIILLY